MPVIRVTQSRSSPKHSGLVDHLFRELQSSQEFGQPMIREETFTDTGMLRVTVIWDDWKETPFEERYEVVQQAYERARGSDVVRRMPLVVALTVPEAVDEGLLPYQVVTLLRKGDSVTYEQCWKAMVAQGGSTLRNPKVVELRFATLEEADECLKRLKTALPGSEDVWGVTVVASGHATQVQ